MKEKIEKKIQELIQQKDSLIANANACNGAIMVLKELLNEENKELTNDKENN